MSRRSRVQASHGAYTGQVPEWFKGLVLSTNARNERVGSNPTLVRPWAAGREGPVRRRRKDRKVA